MTSQYGHGDEGAALELAVDDQTQRRRLHAADRQVVGAVAVGGQRHEAREDGAPDQVDVLTGVGRLGEVEVDRRRLGERRLDLFGGERRVARRARAGRRPSPASIALTRSSPGASSGPTPRRRRRGAALRRRPCASSSRAGRRGCRLRASPRRIVEGLVADQLALAVVVGRDDELVGALRRRAQRGERARRRRRRPPRRGPGSRIICSSVLEAPAPVRVGEDALHHVAAQSDRRGRRAVPVETVGPHLLAAAAVLVHAHPAAEDLGDLARGGILLCDDEPHVVLDRWLLAGNGAAPLSGARRREKLPPRGGRVEMTIRHGPPRRGIARRLDDVGRDLRPAPRPRPRASRGSLNTRSRPVMVSTRSTGRVATTSAMRPPTSCSRRTPPMSTPSAVESMKVTAGEVDDDAGRARRQGARSGAP